MSLLQMIGCEGCGATVEPAVVLQAPRAPDDWFTIAGGAARNDDGRLPTRHVCSPTCMVVLGERLAELGSASGPGIRTDGARGAAS